VSLRNLRNLVFASLVVLPFGICAAQSASAKPPEPTSVGVVYRLDATSQELRPLPDEPWKKCQHTVWPVAVYQCVEVSQERSSFRTRAGENTDFVFKVGSPEKVSLYRFDQKGNKRRFDYGTMGGTKGDQIIKGLAVEVSTYGERSYKLVPASPLTAGEYAIVIADEVYTFGVDQ